MARQQKHLFTGKSSAFAKEDIDFWTILPQRVKDGIEKSLHQANNGQTKILEEVKKILKNR